MYINSLLKKVYNNKNFVIILSALLIVLFIICIFVIYNSKTDKTNKKENFGPPYESVSNIKKIKISSPTTFVILGAVFAYDANGNLINLNITPNTGPASTTGSIFTAAPTSTTGSGTVEQSTTYENYTADKALKNNIVRVRTLEDAVNEKNNFANQYNYKYISIDTNQDADTLINISRFTTLNFSHTGRNIDNSINGSWTYTFNTPQTISAVEIFGRANSGGDFNRLFNVKLELIDDTNTSVKAGSYPDTTTYIEDDAHKVFTIDTPSNIAGPGTDLSSNIIFKQMFPLYVPTSTAAPTSTRAPTTSMTPTLPNGTTLPIGFTVPEGTISNTNTSLPTGATIILFKNPGTWNSSNDGAIAMGGRLPTLDELTTQLNNDSSMLESQLRLADGWFPYNPSETERTDPVNNINAINGPNNWWASFNRNSYTPAGTTHYMVVIASGSPNGSWPGWGNSDSSSIYRNYVYIVFPPAPTTTSITPTTTSITPTTTSMTPTTTSMTPTTTSMTPTTTSMTPTTTSMTPTTTSMTPTTTSMTPTTTSMTPTTTSIYPTVSEGTTTTSMTSTTSGQTTSGTSITSGQTTSGTSITSGQTTIGSSGGSGGNDIGKYGYKMPQMNLYQKDYEGTSNVYSPYIYYNQENFSAMNQYDDTYCKY